MDCETASLIRVAHIELNSVKKLTAERKRDVPFTKVPDSGNPTIDIFRPRQRVKKHILQYGGPSPGTGTVEKTVDVVTLAVSYNL
jgi:hypothetical protein